MLEQQQASVEDQQYHAPIAPPAHSLRSALPPQAEALAASYVAKREADQQGPLRARLNELIAAHLELDAAPTEAARSAIQQLEAERIAAEQRLAAQRQAQIRPLSYSTRPATCLALKWFGAGSLAYTAGMLAIIIGQPLLIGSSVRVALLLSLFFGLPAALGGVVGLRARHRPGMGTFYAIALLIPLVALVSELATRLFTQWGYGSVLAYIMTIFWLPIGVTTAALTGWGRDLHHKRRRDAVNRASRRALSLELKA